MEVDPLGNLESPDQDQGKGIVDQEDGAGEAFERLLISKKQDEGRENQ
jgi:hypothetical protein